jgi:hypothetical protein
MRCRGRLLFALELGCAAFLCTAASAFAARPAITYTFDVTGCFSHSGQVLRSGDAFAIGITGITELGDAAAQGVAFRVK